MCNCCCSCCCPSWLTFSLGCIRLSCCHQETWSDSKLRWLHGAPHCWAWTSVKLFLPGHCSNVLILCVLRGHRCHCHFWTVLLLITCHIRVQSVHVAKQYIVWMVAVLMGVLLPNSWTCPAACRFLEWERLARASLFGRASMSPE